MRLGAYLVARVGNVRTLGDCAARRRLHNNNDDNDNDLDDDLDDRVEPLRGFVLVDVVGGGSILVANVGELLGGDLDDDDLDDDLDDNNDGRPLRTPGDLDDDNDLDDDDLDLDDNAGPLFLRLSDVLRRE